MREIAMPQSKSKLRLLDAAERLFAERGFESVSVRDVTQAANANVAAVNYHFGSREGMVAMVIARHMGPIQQGRLTRLEVLEKKWGSKVIPLEELVDAYLRPLVSGARHSELTEGQHAQLVGRMLALPMESLPESVEMSLQELSARFLKVFSKALPTVAKDELLWRLHFVMGGMIHAMTGSSGLHRTSQGASGEPSLELSLSRFVHFAVAGMREGVNEDKPAAKKGPQVMFDF